MRIPIMCAALACAAALAFTSAAGAAEPKDVLGPLSITPLATPQGPVPTTDGKRHLVYELQIHNVTPAPAKIERPRSRMA